MERLQELISQLQEQHERRVDPSQMLLTIRLLEAELTNMSGRAAVNRGSAKVAVMMPSSMKMYAGQQAFPEARTMPEARTIPDTRTIPEARTVPELPGSGANGNSAGMREFPVIKAAPDIKPPELNSPEPASPEIKTPGTQREIAGTPRETHATPHEEIRTATDLRTIVNPDGKNPGRTIPVAREHEPAGRSYDPLSDIPTFAHQQPTRELNDVIGTNGSSLNDKLKADVMELAAALNDTPVRDLKKAIGVNDRYVFISQLFRGDEVMYERSIKTINGFRILPEAEYWMERELKVKLGWDENREATRHFYQLVKRRFS